MGVRTSPARGDGGRADEALHHLLQRASATAEVLGQVTSVLRHPADTAGAQSTDVEADFHLAHILIEDGSAGRKGRVLLLAPHRRGVLGLATSRSTDAAALGPAFCVVIAEACHVERSASRASQATAADLPPERVAPPLANVPDIIKVAQDVIQSQRQAELDATRNAHEMIQSLHNRTAAKERGKSHASTDHINGLATICLRSAINHS